jgi:hypothetical protein
MSHAPPKPGFLELATFSLIAHIAALLTTGLASLAAIATRYGTPFSANVTVADAAAAIVAWIFLFSLGGVPSFLLSLMAAARMFAPLDPLTWKAALGIGTAVGAFAAFLASFLPIPGGVGFLFAVLVILVGTSGGFCGGAWVWVMAKKAHPDLAAGAGWIANGHVSGGLIGSIPLFLVVFVWMLFQE